MALDVIRLKYLEHYYSEYAGRMGPIPSVLQRTGECTDDKTGSVYAKTPKYDSPLSASNYDTPDSYESRTGSETDSFDSGYDTPVLKNDDPSLTDLQTLFNGVSEVSFAVFGDA